MEQILIQTVNGLVTGMILALVASGLTLIFGIMDVVNFAHGDLVMLGGFVGATTIAATGNFWLALLASAPPKTASQARLPAVWSRSLRVSCRPPAILRGKWRAAERRILLAARSGTLTGRSSSCDTFSATSRGSVP